MRTSVVGPLAMGCLTGIGGAVVSIWAGLPVFVAFLAYSLCGALGVLLGGLANLALADDETAPAGPPLPLAAEPR